MCKSFDTMMRQSMRLRRTHGDNDRSRHLHLRAFLGALLLTQRPIALGFLHPAFPLEFRQGKSERHSGTKLFNRMPIHDGMAIAHIEAKIVLHLPDCTDQAGYDSQLSDLLFVKELDDRPHLPLRGPLDDATQEEVGAAVTREFGDNVGVHRSPLPALRHDRAETRAETAVGPDARQQRPEFDCDTRPAGVLEAPLPQYTLEKCPDAIDARAFVEIRQGKLSLALEHEFPVSCEAIIEDHEGRDQRCLRVLTQYSGRLQLDFHLL